MSAEIYTVLRDFVLTATPTMLIAGIIFIVCILIWIILRPLNYWYWKVDQRDRMLEEMDKKISEIRYLQIKGSKAAENQNQSAAKPCKPADLLLEQKESPEVLTSNPGATEVKPQDCPEPEKTVTRPGKFSTIEDAIDKNGIAYTREQIEQKIRF